MSKSWSNNGKIDLKDCIIQHNIRMLELHRLILNCLDEGDAHKVSEIFRLLVLSHMLKRIPLSEFRVNNNEALAVFINRDLVDKCRDWKVSVEI